MCATKRKPKSPRDPEWQRVHDLMVLYVDARSRGPVPVEQRDELFVALYAAVDRLARSIVGAKGHGRDATPIAVAVAGVVWNKGFTDLLMQFDPKRGDAFSWFYTILLHSWISWLNREVSHGDPFGLDDKGWEILWGEVTQRLMDMPVGHPLGSMPLAPDEALAQKQAHQMLEQLTGRQRTIFYLRREHNFTAEQCAELMSVDKSTIDREMKAANATLVKFRIAP
jgi:RNA polymerase sigma factor (sigma-70 family)